MKNASLPYRISLVLIVAACCFVLSFAAAAFAHQAAAQSQKTWIGYVTDTHCGTHCQVTSSMTPDLKCIRLCVGRGSKYGLWSGDKVYELNPQNLAAEFAAKNVKVTGTMSSGVINATSVVPVPKPKPPQTARP